MTYMKSLSPSKPHLVVMVGIPGAGKSYFATRFAETFKAPLVCHDSIREIISGGQPIYSRDEQTTIDHLVHDQLNELLKTGSTIVIDGGNEARSARQDLAKKAHAGGYKTLFVWVQTDPATARYRSTVGVRGRGSQPILLSDEQYDSIARRFTPPNQSEPVIVISGKHTYATQARTILKKLSQPRAEKSDADTKPAPRAAKSSHRVIVR